MKIAFCNRPSWNAPLGGDGVQMLKTKEHLELKYGLNIVVVVSPEQLDRTFDIIHIFNYVTWQVTESFFKKGLELGIPIVSSSIFWDYTFSYDKITRFFITDHLSLKAASYLKFMISLLVKTTGHPAFLSENFRKKLIFFTDNSKMILPNSIEEGILLEKFIRKNIQNKIHVVYNGAEITVSEKEMNRKAFLDKYRIPDNYILQVGRIEPIKNQINLVYALRNNPDIPIVFVGKVSNDNYFKKLKKLSEKRGNVYFIREVPHDEVSVFYKFASLHVLLSLRESPGLVSLEALYNNCPIVISTKQYAPIETYFPDQSYISDPLNCEEIKEIVLKAYKERKLNKGLITNFSWDVAASQTYEAYMKVLSHK